MEVPGIFMQLIAVEQLNMSTRRQYRLQL